MGYMVSLNVMDRSCVIIGGGRAAYMKAEKLTAAGARVKVIALRIIPQLQELNVETVNKSYEKGDLNGAFLAFALTDSKPLNERIAADARESGVLFCGGNKGDFSVPAAYSGRNISVAVSTGYPRLSAELARGMLKYDALCGKLNSYRQHVLNTEADEAERERLLRDAVTDALARTDDQS